MIMKDKQNSLLLLSHTQTYSILHEDKRGPQQNTAFAFFFMAEIYLIYSSLERKAIFTQQDKAGTASCPFVPLPSA